MILNVHIRKDFDSWIENSKKRRVHTFCGKLTEVKNTGIPTISSYRPMFNKDDAGVDVGWCLNCCDVFIRDNLEVASRIGNPHLRSLYLEAMDMCATQIDLATSSK
jgi:hypothetical protein